jgi:hypothetical protein
VAGKAGSEIGLSMALQVGGAGIEAIGQRADRLHHEIMPLKGGKRTAMSASAWRG